MEILFLYSWSCLWMIMWSCIVKLWYLTCLPRRSFQKSNVKILLSRKWIVFVLIRVGWPFIANSGIWHLHQFELPCVVCGYCWYIHNLTMYYLVSNKTKSFLCTLMLYDMLISQDLNWVPSAALCKFRSVFLYPVCLLSSSFMCSLYMIFVWLEARQMFRKPIACSAWCAVPIHLRRDLLLLHVLKESSSREGNLGLHYICLCLYV